MYEDEYKTLWHIEKAEYWPGEGTEVHVSEATGMVVSFTCAGKRYKIQEEFVRLEASADLDHLMYQGEHLVKMKGRWGRFEWALYGQENRGQDAQNWPRIYTNEDLGNLLLWAAEELRECDSDT
jgi:hypothetical protein